ncbi:hypothetical protein DEJ06_09495 [Curtobacterium sp. MCLR17_051]|nr:hypothetical protein DEJ07_11345 [Curtobacterium sp. MCLR17_053]PZF50479.1 hypothetical protein DEJ06_09495 [Curtobacterium sp. MCLR17_051]
MSSTRTRPRTASRPSRRRSRRSDVLTLLVRRPRTVGAGPSSCVGLLVRFVSRNGRVARAHSPVSAHEVPADRREGRPGVPTRLSGARLSGARLSGARLSGARRVGRWCGP